MTFNQLVRFMKKMGFYSLADIARELDVSPQSVSNWKGRDQVPYKYVVYIQNKYNIDIDAMYTQDVDSNNAENMYTRDVDVTERPVGRKKPHKNNDDHSIIKSDERIARELNHFEEVNISFLDILLGLARNIKLIIILPCILCTVAIINVLFFVTPIYVSTSTFMSSSAETSNKTQMMGFASQFGIDLSTPSSGPKWSYEEVIKSRTMARNLLIQRFDTEKYGPQKELLQILTYGDDKPTLSRDTLEIIAIDIFQNLIEINKDRKSNIFMLKVSTIEPKLSANIAGIIIDKLDEHQRKYKDRKNTETRQFIEERLIDTKIELEESEESVKVFRERNRSILQSPQLQMEQERLLRDVAVLINVFSTLKQQLEKAKIEEVKENDYVVILDPPEVPLYYSHPNKRNQVIVAGFLGIFIGIIIAFVREHAESSKHDEKEKMTKAISLIIKNMTDLLHFRFR